MGSLTIVCLEGESKAFIKNNKALAKRNRQDSGIEIRLFNEEEFPDKTAYERYCEAVEKSTTEYILFANSDTLFPMDGISRLKSALDEGENVYSLWMRDHKDEVHEKILDVRFPLFFPRYVFKRDFLIANSDSIDSEKYFKEQIILLAANEKYNLLNYKIACPKEEFLETKSAKYEKAFDKEWYIPAMQDYIIPNLKKNPTRAEQEVLLYMIFIRYWNNRSIYNKKLLNETELSQFNRISDEALALIDEEVFFSEYMCRRLVYKHCDYFYKRRPGGDTKLGVQVKPDKSIEYTINSHSVGPELLEICIYAINIDNDNLSIDFILQNDCFGLLRDNKVKIKKGSAEYSFEKTGITNTAKLFEEEAIIEPFYRVTIPIGDVDCDTIEFSAEIDGLSVKLPLEFRKTASRLTDKSEHSYCNLKEYRLLYKNNTIVIKKKPGISSEELGFDKDIFKIRKSRKNAIFALGLRRLYRAGLHKPKQKPVWIFFDKIYKGGDNGEHLFKYAYENIDYADSYYVIRKDTDDYKALVKKYGEHILPYNTLRQKLMVLYADIIFATHSGAFKFCGFGPTLQECLRGELKAKIVCIQHGLTIQDMPQFQNRLVDNTRAYFCASQIEIGNLMQEMYGYDSSELHLTGLPRYDGLYSNDKKQILIAPTWRRDIVISGNKTGDSKEYNPRFKESTYFHVYDDLIHNEKLLECAGNNGYKIVYLLHPTVGVQKKDFKIVDGIEIVNGAEALYESYLAESSLMVTDYSGIQFDFAYMKKPVVYYHPEELPPQYENSHFSYEDNGFGPIITKQKDLIDSICNYMENGCVMDEQYKDRVEDFFAYTDHDNCKRICDVIKEIFYR